MRLPNPLVLREGANMKANPRERLLRGALAAVLACGLMVPTSALAAEEQSSETTPPPGNFRPAE